LALRQVFIYEELFARLAHSIYKKKLTVNTFVTF